MLIKKSQRTFRKSLSRNGWPFDGRWDQYIANHANRKRQNNCASNAAKLPRRQCKHKPRRQIPGHINPYCCWHERNFCIPPCHEPRYCRMSRDQRFGAVKYRNSYSEKNGRDQCFLGNYIYVVGLVRLLHRSPRNPAAIKTALNASMLASTSVRNGVIANL